MSERGMLEAASDVEELLLPARDHRDAGIRRGAREVVAIDLDEESAECTRENAARNDAKLEVRHGDALDVECYETCYLEAVLLELR